MKVPIHDHDAELVTLTSVNSSEVAEIIRNALQAEDIRSQVDGDHQGGFTGALAIGILVRKTDLDRAKSVLKEQ